jgi:hypothetical protein
LTASTGCFSRTQGTTPSPTACTGCSSRRSLAAVRALSSSDGWPKVEGTLREVVRLAAVDGAVGPVRVERSLIRHGLVNPQARKRKREDYKRWERSKAMEFWQMDIGGGSAWRTGS